MQTLRLMVRNVGFTGALPMVGFYFIIGDHDL